MSAEPSLAPLVESLQAYHRDGSRKPVTVRASYWESETIDPEDYYRPDSQELPELEGAAIEHARGRVLDIGAGCGRHSLELQKRGLEVTAIDREPAFVEIMVERGVADARCIDLFDPALEGTWDTILILMNGIGLASDRAGAAILLSRTAELLAPDGGILIDSADLDVEIGALARRDIADDLELDDLATVEYRLESAPPFSWLFLSLDELADICSGIGLEVEKIADGQRGAYLARIWHSRDL